MATTVQLPAWLQKYYDRGFRLIFYPSKQKFPIEQNWQIKPYFPSDWDPTKNVGVLLGVEIEPGKFLVDVDFDWPLGMSLALKLIPITHFGFGRASRQISHAFFTSPIALQSRKFVDVDGTVFCELRCAKTDGSIGMQTMVPPSVHPSGEVIELRTDGMIAHCPDIEHYVVLYAIACLLSKHLAGKQFGHEARLAFAGTLLQLGIEEDDVIKVGEAIAEFTGNNVNDIRLTVETTKQKIEAGGTRVLGRSKLAEVIGGDEGRKVCALLRQWVQNDLEFVRDKKDQISANNLQNITMALQKLDVKLLHDEFAHTSVIDYNGYRGYLDDDIIMRTWFEIDRLFHFRPSKEFYYDALRDIAFREKTHPVREYLERLTWDNQARVDTWLINSAGAADTPYVRAVSALVLIAAVRRVRQPGVKFDEMLVLESSGQGLFKSSALRALCPNEDWFGDDLPLNIDSKQIIERTHGRWIIESSDLSGLRPSSVEHLKSMLSRQEDGPVRLAYGRTSIKRKRQFIIIGTTNTFTYLSDSTGNRRFWPIRIKQFDVQWIRANRDQLWAEASAREIAREEIRLQSSLYKYAEMQQERRRNVDIWEDVLYNAYVDGQEGIYQAIPNDDIFKLLNIDNSRREMRHSLRIAAIMQRLGFRAWAGRDEDNRHARGWQRGQASREQKIAIKRAKRNTAMDTI